jgi:PAS domain S-box-containing protein
MSGLQAHLSETLRLSLVYRLAQDLNAELQPIDVLRCVLNATAEALSTPHASIVAVQGQTIVAVSALGNSQERDPSEAIDQVLESGLAGFVLQNPRIVVVNDIATNPLWLPLPDEPFSPQAGSALCVPLVHDGIVGGVMTLAHPSRNYFTSDAVNLVSTISEMGAAALTYTLLLNEARQAEEHYGTLFDDALVPIIVTDLDGTIQTVNRRACEFLGYDRSQLECETITTIHRSDPLEAKRLEALKEGQEVRFQSLVWTQSGHSHPVQVFAKCINDKAIQWIQHDITPQATLEDLRRDLSAMVYHDMRGPLGNIYTSLEALNMVLAEYPDATVHRLIDFALRSEQQARNMIDSLLDVQYLEEGSKLLTRANAYINGLVHHAVDLMQSNLEDKSIILRLTLADDLPTLYIDEDMIRRVILNLLDNAVKYTPDEGTITVSTTTNGPDVLVRIKDTGPGIPAEAQSTIFDKFARIKQQHTPHGVGLGLAFCKLAVEAHAGRIWVQSDTSGSTFTFALPVEAPPTQELPLLGAAKA